MSRKKITFGKIEPVKNNVRNISSLELDFSQSIVNGTSVSLKKYSEWCYLMRELAMGLESYVNNNPELTSMRSVKSYIKYFRWFFDYLEEVIPFINKQEIRLKDITNEIFTGYYRWCHAKTDKTATVSKAYHSIRILIEEIKSINKSLVNSELKPIKKSPKGFVQYAGAEVYSHSEVDDIKRVCREEIDKTLNRLRKGQEYLKNGQNPCYRAKKNEQAPWSKIENILWYVVNKINGKILTRSELKREGHHQFINVICGTRDMYKYRKEEVYGYLYPSREDLIPFILMISIKTGLNKESISSLKRDCIDEASKTDESFKLRFSKSKTHTTCDSRTFSCNGRFSVYGLIKEVLKITEPLVEHAVADDKDLLFIGHVNNSTRGTVHSFSDQSYLTYMLNVKKDHGWFYSHGLGNINFKFDKARETYATNRYKKTGNLGKVQKNLRHKDIGTTELHYIDGNALRDTHEQTICHVQNNIIFEGVVRGDNIISLNRESNELGDRVIEQDIFFSTCKDFYNRPGGEINSPCDRPWSCFTCKNGVWTTGILPRLYAFFNFINEQKACLPQADWEAKFSTPYFIIKDHIFPKFKEETLDWAKMESVNVSMYLPNSIRMV